MAVTFAKSFYISLHSSTERRKRFCDNVEAVDWPEELPKPEWRLGVREAKPAWYQARGADWGCMRAHLNVYVECILQGISPVMIFEDDCLFPADFARRYRRFTAAVPDDWGMIYLGGNHTLLPEIVNNEVLLCRRTNMNIAIGFRDDVLAAPFAFLARFREQCATQHVHIDTLWATILEHRRVKAYAPHYWITAQAANVSDRTGCHWTEERFELPEEYRAKMRHIPSGPPPTELIGSTYNPERELQNA